MKTIPDTPFQIGSKVCVHRMPDCRHDTLGVITKIWEAKALTTAFGSPQYITRIRLTKGQRTRCPNCGLHGRQSFMDCHSIYLETIDGGT